MTMRKGKSAEIVSRCGIQSDRQDEQTGSFEVGRRDGVRECTAERAITSKEGQSECAVCLIEERRPRPGCLLYLVLEYHS